MKEHLTDRARAQHQGGNEEHEGHRSRSWMMMACCVPMLAIAGTLVVTGVVSAGFLLYALGCTAMMAIMMRGMGHSRGSGG